ncbi:MAG: leucyl aminopeptidase family protein [Alphaproteobacteria bacterium]
MADCFAARTDARTVPITAMTRDAVDKWTKAQPDAIADWVRDSGFDAKPGAILSIPAVLLENPETKNAIGAVLAGTNGPDDFWSWGAIGQKLPAGRYRIDGKPGAKEATRIAIGWGLGAYRFGRYKDVDPVGAKLVIPAQADKDAVDRTVSSIYLTRDLINTPASDMGPAELASAARALAKEFKAKFKVTVGNALLRDNFPSIHAVGRASTRDPRLIDFQWGRASDPKITLVGKGVCFDTGGLDLKPSSGMLMMKKDMGGAANVLGLARMIMMAGLRIRLRVLIPAVENSVAGNAYRPMDVIKTRKGLTIEIGNTDAEGRVVLSDALALAAEEKPDMILDFATLTGAARVALGTALPAMFVNDDKLAASFEKHGSTEDDPVWRMPLWQPYRSLIDSKIADMNNAGSVPQGGAITAALFLESFVEEDIPWAHFDIMAWNRGSQPGKPEGGEAMAIRTAFAVIANSVKK